MANLTRGALQKMFHKAHKKSDGPVTLQVTAVKKVNMQGGGAGVRVKCSDGLHENQMCMYAGDITLLPQYAVIKLTSWSFTNSAQPEKAILQIESFDISKQPAEIQNKKIGNPTVWKYSGGEMKMETNFPKSENKENKPLPEGGRYMAIQALTPYMNKWTIKGRITQKGDMREWNNARGSGKLFSFTIADETCDLKVTSFKEDAERFIEMVTKGKIYQITNGSLKAKNAQYNKTEHDYELTLGRNTVVTELEEDAEMPTIRYNFLKIDQLEQKEKFQSADILAIIKAADENVSMIMIKSRNEESPKREMTLVDDSMKTIKCTLWGDNALNFDNNNIGTVVALKEAVVSDFGGRSLSLGFRGEITYGYEGEGATVIRNWWADAKNDNFNSLSQGASSRVDNFVQLSSILTGENYQGDKPYYFTSKGVVTFLRRENVLYKACPGKDGGECKKKLIDESNGNYRCEKCDFTTPTFVYRMILNAQIADNTHSAFMTFFADQGEQLLNCASADLGTQIENMDSSDFDATMSRALFNEYIIGARAKIETYQDEQRTRVTASKIAIIDYVKYGNQLVNDAVAGGHLNL